MKKSRPPKRHQDHTAEPLLPAVVAVDVSARRPPGHLIVGIGASAGGLLAINADFDCAILDFNIRGGHSYAVADLLLTQGCSLVLTTGDSDWSLPKHLSRQKKLTKPYSTRALENHRQTLANQFASSGNTGPGSIS